MVDIKEKLDYVSHTGNYLVVEVLAAPFAKVAEKQNDLLTALERIPEFFGDEALDIIGDVNLIHSSKFNKIDTAALGILHYAVEVAEAKTNLALSESERYTESYWDNLWDAVNDEGIEYEDPLY